MAGIFIESFRKYVSSLGIRFLEKGLLYSFPDNNFAVLLTPAEPSSSHYEDSEERLLRKELADADILYLYEDRWFHDREMIQKRIMARLNNFKSIFARKCNVASNYNCGNGSLFRSNSNKGAEIREFIDKYHPYGYAKSKFMLSLEYEGQMVAAAAFSAPRPMPRGAEELTESFSNSLDGSANGITIFDSYEWVRYISLPDVRVVGGMGKLLDTFIKSMKGRMETNGCAELRKPIEIMSYSDDEWSSGSTYLRLGFTEVAHRESVTYFVDKKSHERLSYRKLLINIRERDINLVDSKLNVIDEESVSRMIAAGYYTIKNRGSRKFLLQTI